jgi:hypothetical protein
MAYFLVLLIVLCALGNLSSSATLQFEDEITDQQIVDYIKEALIMDK